MPAININGNYRHISWQRLNTYATMAGVTAETFLNRYGTKHWSENLKKMVDYCQKFFVNVS